MIRTFAFVLLPLALAVILLLLRKKLLTTRWLSKRDDQGFADPEQLADLLDEWNRKHRPDLWSRGGDWPGKNSRAAGSRETSTAGLMVAG